jgi:hypothetical protein
MLAASSKDIQKARQSAKRTRAAIACARCKVGKLKCSDYRPCKRCLDSNNGESCTQGRMTKDSTAASSNQVQHHGASHQNGFAYRSAEAQMRALPWSNTEYELPNLFISESNRPCANYHTSVTQPGLESRDQQYRFLNPTTAHGMGSNPGIGFNASDMLQREARSSQTEEDTNRYLPIVVPPADVGGSSRSVWAVLPSISSIYAILDRQSQQQFQLAPFTQGPSPASPVLQPPNFGNHGAFLSHPADALHRLLVLAAPALRLQSCRTLPP